MTTAPPTISDRRLRRVLHRGPQRRQAFRVTMSMQVQIDEPVQMACELHDLSFAGAGFDGELPCPPGTRVSFRLEVPTYGAVLVPTCIAALEAEVVRVERGRTGLRFVDLDHERARAVHEFLNRQQRLFLAARRGRENERSFRG